MPVTSADRIIAGLAAAYMGYRLWSGWNEGIVYGDGDNDVHAHEHPTAFVLTVISVLMIIAICSFIAIGPGLSDLPSMIAWLWRV